MRSITIYRINIHNFPHIGLVVELGATSEIFLISMIVKNNNLSICHHITKDLTQTDFFYDRLNRIFHL